MKSCGDETKTNKPNKEKQNLHYINFTRRQTASMTFCPLKIVAGFTAKASLHGDPLKLYVMCLYVMTQDSGSILSIKPLKFDPCIVCIFSLFARMCGKSFLWNQLQRIMLIHLCRYIWSSCTRSAFSFMQLFFFSFSKEWVGGLALLWACSCILGFLTGSQEANKTLLYLGGVGAAFRLTCRRWDETQRSHTITAFYSMNEQRPLEMASSQPGGFAQFLQSSKSPNTKSGMICRIQENLP